MTPSAATKRQSATSVPPQGSAPARRRLHGRAVAAALALVVMAAVAGWLWMTGRDTGHPPSAATGVPGLPEGTNLVVITMDTTRADHLGAYGSRDVRTPAFDRIASEGVLFESATTTAPLTLPAHSSIFTGKFPPEHGARDNGGFFLGQEQTTLAEVLKGQGFQTGGFIAAYVLDRKWGIAQGFDTYFDDFEDARKHGGPTGEIQRPGNEVVDRALPWIDGVKQKRFFAWIHLYDPHTPYAPPEPFKSEYKDRPYRGEIAFMDAQIGRVLTHLEQAGLLDRTIVVAMGDHGESLGEHHEDTHAFFVYESTTHVPFAIRAPAASLRARRVGDPVRVIDMMPTVLDLLGVRERPVVSGTSLVPLMTGERATLDLEAYAEAMYPLHHFGWSDLRALRAGRYKAIDAPTPELYDLAQDPHETTNLYEARRTLGDQMVARLRQMDQAFRKAAAPQAAPDVDPEVRARLAALGYVGTFVADANDVRTDRADPKDKIALFNKMSTARETAAGKGGFAAAVALFNEVLREDPKVIDAWFSLGNLYFRERRYRQAIEHYSKALALKPDYDLAVINIAAAYRNLGDDDAALAGFERYLQIDPRDPYVRYQMGEIYLDRGNLDRAETEFRKALEIDARVAQAKNALGVIAFQRGNTAAAETLSHEALALKADVRLAHYNLALIAEQRGDLQLAEKEYLLELEQHPDAYKAAFNLSRLYAQIGEAQLELDALQQSLDGNPEFAKGYAFLAKAYLDRRMDPARVEQLARKALSISKTGDAAPLAHLVLAELYGRTGRPAESARELAAAKAMK